MRRLIYALALCAAAPTLVNAAAPDAVERAVKEHILPRFALLQQSGERLATTAEAECAPTSERLRTAFHDGFDAWVAVNHLRFGPTEVDNRAFALAFWPDPRGKTPKALASLIRSADPIVDDVTAFETVSVAARGYYALERLLYAPLPSGSADYKCRLVRAIARDIAATSADIAEDWRTRYADLMTRTAPDSPYRTDLDAVRALFKALATGVQFVDEVRLGRPLGAFDRPRPKRAEARLSARSLRHVEISLNAAAHLAKLLAADHSRVEASVSAAHVAALDAASKINEPTFAAVADPMGRFRVEVLQERVRSLRHVIRAELGPALGVTEGFNALDGD